MPWKRYIRNKDPTQYKKVRNKVSNKIRLADRRHQNKIVKACKGNPKRFWKYVKSKTRDKEPIGDLVASTICRRPVATPVQPPLRLTPLTTRRQRGQTTADFATPAALFGYTLHIFSSAC